MRKKESFIRKESGRSKPAHNLFVFVLVLVLTSMGTMLSVQAETVRSGAGSRSTAESSLRETVRSSGTVKALRPVVSTGRAKKDRLLLRQRLADSNRLALELGALKKKAQDGTETARLVLRRVVKNKADLTGDQLAVLKDVSKQLKAQQEKIAVQGKVIREIRDRLATLRVSGQYAEAAAVVDELIAAQRAMKTTLQESDVSVGHIADIIGKN